MYLLFLLFLFLPFLFFLLIFYISCLHIASLYSQIRARVFSLFTFRESALVPIPSIPPTAPTTSTSTATSSKTNSSGDNMGSSLLTSSSPLPEDHPSAIKAKIAYDQARLARASVMLAQTDLPGVYEELKHINNPHVSNACKVCHLYIFIYSIGFILSIIHLYSMLFTM